MRPVVSSLDPHAAHVVGWALIHFLWQGAGVALALSLFLALARRGRPEIRYAAGCVALVVMALCPLVTAGWVSAREGERAAAPLTASARAWVGRSVAVSAVRVVSLQREAASRQLHLRRAPRLERLLPWLVLGWAAGCAVLTLRLLGGWVVVQRLRCRGTRPAGAEIQRRATELGRRLGVRVPVVVLESAAAAMPVAFGCLRGVVVLPAAMVTGLPAAQLDALLAHELAHVRRHDYLVNLLQSLVEAALFYHPAVWWVSEQIRIEREHCCDDLVLSVLGDRVTYARALAALELAPRWGTSLALAGGGGSLLARIRRVLGRTPEVTRGPRLEAGAVPWAAACCLLMLFVAAETVRFRTSSRQAGSHPAGFAAAASFAGSSASGGIQSSAAAGFAPLWRPPTLPVQRPARPRRPTRVLPAARPAASGTRSRMGAVSSPTSVAALPRPASRPSPPVPSDSGRAPALLLASIEVTQPVGEARDVEPPAETRAAVIRGGIGPQKGIALAPTVPARWDGIIKPDAPPWPERPDVEVQPDRAGPGRPEVAIRQTLATVRAFVDALNSRDMPAVAERVAGGRIDPERVRAVLGHGPHLLLARDMHARVDGDTATVWVTTSLSKKIPHSPAFQRRECLRLRRIDGEWKIEPGPADPEADEPGWLEVCLGSPGVGGSGPRIRRGTENSATIEWEVSHRVETEE